MTKKILYMFNWVCIIAIAGAFFISSIQGQQKTAARAKAISLSTKSSQAVDWKIDDPLMMLFVAGVSLGNGDNDLSMDSQTANH